MPLRKKILWYFQTGGDVHRTPVAFAVDGNEYVEIAASASLNLSYNDLRIIL
jgi:hypothetical protein